MVLGQQSLIVLQMQNLIKVFQYILKSLGTFLFKTISIVMPKNANKTKETATNFDLTTDSSFEKY